jgi:hypothetical protein
MRLGLLIGCCAVSLLSACGQAAVHPAANTSHSTAMAQSQPTQRADVAVELAAKLGDDVSDATLAAPPDAFTGVSGVWLYLTVPTLDGPVGVQARWHALLVAGDYNASVPPGVAPVVGFSIVPASDPNCATALSSLSCGAPGTRLSDLPSYDTSGWGVSDANLNATVAANLAASGLSLVSISFLRPDSFSVPVVVAKTANPGEFLRLHQTGLAAVFGDPVDLEGAYLEVVDGNGNAAAVSALASRLSQGVSWIRPDLAPAANPEG